MPGERLDGQTIPGDSVREIIDSYDLFVRDGRKNILDRSILAETGLVVWVEDEDAEITSVGNSESPAPERNT